MTEKEFDSKFKMGRLSYPFELKVALSKQRIRQWYEQFNGDVYVAFSGGRDSTVLLHLVRSLYPQVVAVFVDTGLEYPEIRDFVKTTDNVTWVKPKMPFGNVIKKYGYPVVSKEQSQYIQEFRAAKSTKMKEIRWNGNKWGRGKISKKWRFLVDAPFLISEKCCNIIKKNPMKTFEKENKLFPFIGTTVDESSLRAVNYVRYSCNATNLKRPTSRPLSFWGGKDILSYLELHNIPCSEIYNMGYPRTGCMFCLFGVHQEKEPNRFQRMQQTHPKQYRFCMEHLGIQGILEYLGVPYKNRPRWKNQEMFKSKEGA